jgi:hypothetical protein
MFKYQLGSKFNIYDLKFDLPMFTTTDVLKVSIHNAITDLNYSRIKP